jgi:indole-3-glycerol phosphate synthase
MPRLRSANASFAGVFPRGKFSIIAEVKRRSPSAGELDASRDPIEIARLYESAGAAAISVLTDAKYFGGSFDFLRDIARAVKIPVLCKDFVIDEVQIDLARECGASAILLIAEALDEKALNRLYRYAKDSGLDVLMEAHERENIPRAVATGARVVGINNRNLKTMETSLEHSINLIGLIPRDRVRLSLSAVETPEDVKRLLDAGFDGALVGSSLMRSPDSAAKLRELLSSF